MCKKCPPLVSFPSNEKDMPPEELALISDEEELRYGIRRDHKIDTDWKQDMLESEEERAVFNKETEVFNEEIKQIDEAITWHENSKEKEKALRVCSKCNFSDYTENDKCPMPGCDGNLTIF